ncbi:MAG: sensor domain-containing diguanylate cyclase [Burkholderiaceae bacterium]|nr:sensor domain-containing diguanylate cyclase [Burkholderiaceae bacterium]
MVDAVPPVCLAWTWFGATDTREIVPQVCAGRATAYAQGLVIRRNLLTALGPAMRVLRGERLKPFRISAASPYGPWRDAARRYGVRSVLVMPLQGQGEDREPTLAGIFALYAEHPDFFSDERVALLEAIAPMLGSVLTRAAMEDRLRRQAHTDPLTGLGNRAAFAHQVSALNETGRRHAVMMVDLDRFKRINDVHGHAAGDAVIRQTADLLSAAVRAGDVLARFGGEEFVLVLRDSPMDAALLRAEALRACIAEHPFALGQGEVIQVTSSIGCAPWTPPQALEAALAQADAGLYRAKDGGRNAVQVSLNDCLPGVLG